MLELAGAHGEVTESVQKPFVIQLYHCTTNDYAMRVP
jgi:hypothetical protein